MMIAGEGPDRRRLGGRLCSQTRMWRRSQSVDPIAAAQKEGITGGHRLQHRVLGDAVRTVLPEDNGGKL